MCIISVMNRDMMYRQLIPKGQIGAELGVWRGENAYSLCINALPSKLYLVDPYPTNMMGYQDSSYRTWVIQESKNLLKEFEETIKIEWVEQYDWDWLATLPDQYLDWVYLDSTHLRYETTRELDLLVKKVKKGGLISGHDLWHAENKGQVLMPLLEKIQDGLLKLIAITEDVLSPFPSFLAKVL